MYGEAPLGAYGLKPLAIDEFILFRARWSRWALEGKVYFGLASAFDLIIYPHLSDKINIPMRKGNQVIHCTKAVVLNV
jgi:hypothetical protein